MTDVLELYIIEIPKARRVLDREPQNELAQWMMFLDDPNKEEVSRIMSENKEIKKAMNELQEMSEDEELRRLAELKEKAIRDEKSAKYRWTEEGIKQGIEQGIEKVAKRMIELNIEIQDIIKFTGLTEEQILKLK